MAGAAGLILSFLAGVMVGRGVDGTAAAAAESAPGRRGAGRRRAVAAPATPAPSDYSYPQRLESDRPEEGLERPARPRRDARARAPRPARRRRPATTPAASSRRPPRPARPPLHGAPAEGAGVLGAGLRGAGGRVQGQGQRRRHREGPPGPGLPAYAVAPAPGATGLFTVRVGVYRDRADAETVHDAPARRQVQALHHQAVAECAPPRPRPDCPTGRARAARSRRGRAPLRVLLREKALNTVCEEARCPNLGECFTRGTATFMLLGDRCTRRCGYCSVATARPLPPDPAEPERVAEAAARMGLRYVVLTSVNRDDLADGGAVPLRATRCARCAGPCPGRGIEVLTPDFKGDRAALARGPRRGARGLQPQHRDGAASVPAAAAAGPLPPQPGGAPRRRRQLRPGQATKSGLMVGLGETDDEVARGARRPARGRGRHRDHRPVPAPDPRARAGRAATSTPEAFRALEDEARALGFPTVYSGVFVRSSFNAEEVYRGGGAR